MPEETAILVVSHGSHSPQTKEEVSRLVEKIKAESKYKFVDFAFLEIENPDIPRGLKNCIDSGAKKIIVLLNFLNSGRHVDEDIPAIVDKIKAEYPTHTFVISPPIGQHPNIVSLFLDYLS